jgi:lactoylglutathione lyase
MTLDIKKFSHLGLRVSDLEASLSFYVDVLGFEKLFQKDYSDPRHPDVKNRIAGCRAPGSEVAFELLELGIGKKETDKTGKQSIDASAAPVMAFGVADLEETHRRIQEAGLRLLMPPTEMSPGVRMLFLADPDGRTIECAEFSTGALSLLDNLALEETA